MIFHERVTALYGAIRDVDGSSVLNDYFSLFDDVTRGARRLPHLSPGEEISMTFIHRFALGAAVVLVTSLPEIERQRIDALNDAEQNKRYSFGERNYEVRTMRTFQSVEEGKVIGRAEYAERPGEYLVRYKAADGRQVEEWFSANAIAADPRAQDEEQAAPSLATDGVADYRQRLDPAQDAEDDPADDSARSEGGSEWQGTVIKVSRYAADGGLTGTIEIPVI